MLPAYFTHPYDRVGQAGMKAIWILTVQNHILPFYIRSFFFLGKKATTIERIPEETNFVQRMQAIRKYQHSRPPSQFFPLTQ